MLPKVPIILLAFYAFLYFQLGDALVCRDCMWTDNKCLDSEDADTTCTADPEKEKCTKGNVYEDGKKAWAYVGCIPKQGCGTKEEETKDFYTEFSCCDDADFCNEGL